QVGEQAQLFEQVRGEVVGLIDHQQRRALVGAVGQEVIGQGESQFLLAATGMGQRQVVQDRLEKSGTVGKVAVGDEGAANLSSALKQAVAEERLAEAGRSGEQSQSLAVGQCLQELRQGVLVPGGRVVARAVRRRTERPLPQTKVRLIHATQLPLDACADSAPCPYHRNRV